MTPGVMSLEPLVELEEERPLVVVREHQLATRAAEAHAEHPAHLGIETIGGSVGLDVEAVDRACGGSAHGRTLQRGCDTRTDRRANSVASGRPTRNGAGMDPQWTIRRATIDDYPQIGALFEAVAGEGRWIGTELPIDYEARRAEMAELLTKPDEFGAFVAVVGDEVVGNLGIEKAAYGVAHLGMMVADAWRGRGVGSGLLEAAIAWAREVGAHKVALQMWPHNDRARALYEKYGFVDEGRLVRHYRRKNGELWDAVMMGLALDEPRCRLEPGTVEQLGDERGHGRALRARERDVREQRMALQACRSPTPRRRGDRLAGCRAGRCRA